MKDWLKDEKSVVQDGSVPKKQPYEIMRGWGWYITRKDEGAFILHYQGAHFTSTSESVNISSEDAEKLNNKEVALDKLVMKYLQGR